MPNEESAPPRARRVPVLRPVGEDTIVTRDSRIVKIVEAIKSVGPRNCSLISRMTGIPIETVRYKIKRQLLRKGIAFHAVVDYELLGLERYWVTMDFQERFRSQAPQILDVLSKFGLTYYIRVLPYSSYETMIAIPRNSLHKYEEMLSQMTSSGVLNLYHIEPLDWVHCVSLRPEYYDFDKGQWDFSWSSLVPLSIRPNPLQRVPDGETKPDMMDLFILKEMQVSSLTHLTTIAKKLGVGPKTLRYHYVQHVRKDNLLAGYAVRWSGASRNSSSLVILLVRLLNVEPNSISDLEKVFFELPFTWQQTYSEKGGVFTAILSLPSDQYVNTLSHLASALPQFRGKMETLVLDNKYAVPYSIPYEMFDPVKGWNFDATAARIALGRVVGKIEAPSQKNSSAR
jgi:DNA-binding Lrp family transcriptional regulator